MIYGAAEFPEEMAWIWRDDNASKTSYTYERVGAGGEIQSRHFECPPPIVKASEPRSVSS
jgi:hypothetical protein